MEISHSDILFVFLSGSFIMDTVEISNKGLDVRNRDVWKLMGDVDSTRSILSTP